MKKPRNKEHAENRLPKSFFDSRYAVADELAQRIEELSLTQAQAGEIMGVSKNRISMLLSKNYAPEWAVHELVQVWGLVEAILHLGAHITISVDRYSSPGKGSVKFIAPE